MLSYMATRASRSSPNTRTLIRPCESRLAAISFMTDGGQARFADHHDRLERVGFSAQGAALDGCKFLHNNF